jgi:hypothetical protein
LGALDREDFSRNSFNVNQESNKDDGLLATLFLKEIGV